MASSAMAQGAPPLLPVQGFLTDDSDVPIDGEVDIDFRIYTVEVPTVPEDSAEWVHEETLTVAVDAGNFAVYLGTDNGNALDLAIFRDHTDLFLGMRVSPDTDFTTPLVRLGSVPFAGFAQYCADAETLAGNSAGDLQQRVVGTCSGGQVMREVLETGEVTCAAETDPQVGSLSSGRWCTSNGTTVDCTADAPVTAEADPQVGTLTSGRWCTTNGTTVDCTANAPVTAETDPQVGSLTSGRWCTSNGSTVNCTTLAPYPNCTIRTSAVTTLTNTTFVQSYNVDCLAGETVMGGGPRFSSWASARTCYVMSSYAVDADSWRVSWSNINGECNGQNVYHSAVCCDLTP